MDLEIVTAMAEFRLSIPSSFREGISRLPVFLRADNCMWIRNVHL
jgi:hypothetical protein